VWWCSEVRKPLVRRLISHNPPPRPEASVLFYRSSLPLSRSTLTYLSGVLRRHRKQTGSKKRALPAGQQALMTLAYLKNAHTFAQLGAGSASGPRPCGGT
jgi:hypothetical protein